MCAGAFFMPERRMQMKTRQQIYENEAARILRDITTYHSMRKEQLFRMHPEIKPEITEKILYHLQNNRRVFYDKQTQMLCDTRDRESDTEWTENRTIPLMRGK